MRYVPTYVLRLAVSYPIVVPSPHRSTVVPWSVFRNTNNQWWDERKEWPLCASVARRIYRSTPSILVVVPYILHLPTFTVIFTIFSISVIITNHHSLWSFISHYSIITLYSLVIRYVHTYSSEITRYTMCTIYRMTYLRSYSMSKYPYYCTCTRHLFVVFFCTFCTFHKHFARRRFFFAAKWSTDLLCVRPMAMRCISALQPPLPAGSRRRDVAVAAAAAATATATRRDATVSVM